MNTVKVKRDFKYSSLNSLANIKQNSQHNFAMSHSMMIYGKNALYSFIPKNACSTLRLSVAIENGCIEDVEQGNWIHANNQSFNATLGEALKVDYSFVILRCPFRRLASVFLDKFVSKEVDAWQYRNLLKREIELDDLTFRQFVMSLKKPMVLNSNIHWRPQAAFLIYKDYDDYFSLENFTYAVAQLKDKLDFNVVDARCLTNHGTDRYSMVDDVDYSDMCAFDIALMKRSGQCPMHSAMYDDELIAVVKSLYKQDFQLYIDKFGEDNLLF